MWQSIDTLIDFHLWSQSSSSTYSTGWGGTRPLLLLRIRRAEGSGGYLRNRFDQHRRAFFGLPFQTEFVPLLASCRGSAHLLSGCGGGLVILRQQRRTIRAGLDRVLGARRTGYS